jgi:hypothetical protein
MMGKSNTSVMKNSMEAPEKLKVELPCDLATPLVRVYLKKYKSGNRKATAHLCLLQHYSQ